MPTVGVHSFTTHYSQISNVLFNDVLISKPFDPTPEQIISIEHQAKKYKAIWDTGATHTVITKKIVEECDLKPLGVSEVLNTSGPSLTNWYLVNVWLPNKVIISNVKVSLAKELIGDVEVLIGMNILNTGDFAVTNRDGKTVFSFRIPSVECIDFVKNPFKPKPTLGIPHGKKFKHR